jgi:dTDP-6-deoxy-L-talose 4-dehydrogenase (NAD+)
MVERGQHLRGPIIVARVRILVTGAGGFIGSVLVRQALAAGHEVLALVRAPARAAARLPAHPALTVLAGSLAEPPWESIARFGAGTCVHAAWITQPEDYRASPENARLQAESLALARGLFARGVRRLVALGTCEEYAPSPAPLHETGAPLAPLNAYALAKHNLRLALEAGASAAGASLTWARLFQLYGPGEHPARLPSLVVRRLRAGEPVTLHTPTTVRDWIHVDDVASALLVLVQAAPGRVVNVGTGVGHSVERVVRTLARGLGRPDLVSVTAPPGDAAATFVADSTRLRDLGWTPRVDLDAGLAALIRHILESP